MEYTNTTPAISCILPVFNGQRWIDAAIQSILMQSVADLELIIVDDGSTDTTPIIAKRFATLDSRVVVLTQSNQGVAAALNAGLSIARGEFIARMDADDISDSSRFEKQLSALRKNPDIAILGTRAVTIGECDSDLHKSALQQSLPYIHRGRCEVLCFPPRLLQVLHPSIMFRAEMARRIGGYSEEFRYAEDYDFYLRACRYGVIAEMSEYLLRYRVHGSNISVLKLREQEQNASRCDLKSVECFRAESGLPPLRISTHTQLGWVEFRCFRRKMTLNDAGIRLLLKCVYLILVGSLSTSPSVTLRILARCVYYAQAHVRCILRGAFGMSLAFQRKGT